MKTQTLISLAEVSRKCNIPESRIDKLVEAGVLQCDATFGKYFLFKPDRLPQIQAEVENFKAVAA